MPVSLDVLKNRMRKSVGNDSQETIGQKLHMTQGNVSKLLTGLQQPTLDTLYRFSEVYNVSIDWLLGLSDNKEIANKKDECSYALATEVITDMVYHQSTLSEGKNQTISITIKDPILVKMIKKGTVLKNTDEELFQSWKREKLSILKNTSILWKSVFEEDEIEFLIDDAHTEEQLLLLYEKAKSLQDFLIQMMEDAPGPLGY